nr:FG-GAP-like repeat-containing protein [Hymenobacter arizonensis]
MLPARHAVAAPRLGPVSLTFTQAITAASATNLRVYGNQARGRRPGTMSGGNTATLNFAPTQAFMPGERVSVTVPNTLTNAAGIGASRQVYQFMAATGGTGGGFFLDTTEIAHTNSRDQVLGDIDNDGDLDLLTSAGLYGMYSYFNDGQGHFTAHSNVAVGRTPSGATLADVNGDGFLDLLAGDADNATVAIALNNGNGEFGILALAGQLVTVGARPVSIATGDVDGDGDLDFVTANFSSNTASVGFNSSTTGFFTATTSTVSVGQQPTAVQLGDIDNDGDLDLLTANSGSNSVSVRLNNGAGLFFGSTSVAVGVAPTDLALVDLDLDGDLDLLTTNAIDGTLSVRFNNLGTFSGTTTLALPTGSTPSGLSIGDVDADGDPDVVVAQGSGGQVITYINNGAGVLAIQYGALELAASSFRLPNSLGVTLGDVDGDLDLDIITADGSRGRVVLGRNGLAPPVVAPALSAFSPGAGPVGTGVRIAGSALSSTSVVLFNGTPASFVVNSNVQLTVAVPAGASTGPISVTTPGGTVTLPQPFVVTSGPVAPVLITSTVPARNAVAASATAALQATFNSPISSFSASGLRVFGSQRRGRQLTTASGGGTATLTLLPSPAFLPGERVSLTLPASLTGTSGGSVRGQVVDFRIATGGTGEGVFEAAGSTSVSASATVQGLRAVDIDNDGDLDIVAAQGSNTSTSSLLIRINNGTGTFTALTTGAPSLQSGDYEAEPADVDGDGDFDLLVLQANRISVWSNNGQGRFVPGATLVVPTNNSLRWLRVGDLDADGDLDVAFAQNSDDVYIALNNGTGMFVVGGKAEFNNIYQMRLADLDADGDLDIMTVSNTELATALNNGHGVMVRQPGQAVNTPRIVQDMEIGDLTGDGFPDAVVITYNYHLNGGGNLPGLLAVWPGLGNGQFGPRGVPVELPLYPKTLALADVNSDGRLDALTMSTDRPSNTSVLNSAASLQVRLGDGRGGLLLPEVYALSVANQEVSRPEVGDFDGDGDVDLAFGNLTAATVAVRFNTGRPVPTILSMIPAQGPVGTRVSLFGTNLTSTKGITFGGVAATEILVVSPTECAVVVPAAASTGPVALTTPGGTGTSPNSFTVVVPVPVATRTPARNAESVALSANVSVSFPQSLSTGSAGALVVHSEQRQGRRAGTASGAGTASRTFAPSLGFAPGERVQVSLPVPNGVSTGSAQPQVYNFTAATSGPGRANLRWAQNHANAPGGFYAYYTQTAGAVGDFDEDGAPDLVSIELFSSSQLRILFNDGHGKFGARTLAFAVPLLRGVRVADLNGDSHLDLLMVEYFARRSNNREVNRLTWCAGTGTGSFGAVQPLYQFNGNGENVEVAVGDLNADGELDIAALIQGSDSVLVAMNQGNGTFRRHANAAAVRYANTLRLADIDNNGTLDLLTVGSGTPYMSRGMGTGTGDFVTASPLVLPAGGISLEIGDLDNNGNIDLVLGTAPYNTQGNVHFFLGDGQGGFVLSQQVGNYSNPGFLRLADFDADGALDLLMGQLSSYSGVTLLLNNGSGQFGRPASFGDKVVPRCVTVADMDLDGSLDLTIGGDSLSGPGLGTTAGLFVYHNRPVGPSISSFTPTSGGAGTVVTLTGTALSSVTGVTVGGVSVPFTVVSSTQITLTIRTNTATGRIVVNSPFGTSTSSSNFTMPAPTISSFTPSSGAVQRLVTVTGTYFSGATAVRFNGLTAPGFNVVSETVITVLVPAGVSTGALSVTTPSGTASSATPFTFSAVASGFTPGRNAQHVARNANLNLNFSQIVSSAAAADIRVFGNQVRGKRGGVMAGGGSTSLTFDPAQDFAPGEEVSVTIPNSFLGTQGGQSSKQVFTFRAATGGSGMGTFSSPQTLALSGGPWEAQIGDIDNDGDQDVVTVNYTNGGYDFINFALNNGNGTFVKATPLQVSAHAHFLRLADFNGDGALDIVTVHDFIVSVRMNDGTGTFGSVQNINGPGGQSLEVGDIDGDGDLDIVTVNYNQVAAYVIKNNGTGTFTTGAQQSMSTPCRSIRLGDVDSDGDLDLVATGTNTNGSGNLLVVRLNDGNGTFTGTYSLALPRVPVSFSIADLDNDGDLDAAVVGYHPNFSIADAGLNVYLNDGLARFTPGQHITYATHNEVPRGLVFGDIDGDGDLDALINVRSVTGGLNEVRPHLNNGSALFTSVTAVPTTNQDDIAVGDLDGDGDLDFVAPSVGNFNLVIHLNGPARPTATASATAQRLVLYPNPAQQQFTLAVPAGLLTQKGTIMLLNSLGQVVYQQPVAAAPAGIQTVVDVRRLAAGMYTVHLKMTNVQPVVGRLMIE